MKVKNILVEEKEYVMSEIERFLCVDGISYVKVDNEIHCPNLILRFYEFKDYLDSMITIRSEDIESPSLDSLIRVKEEKEEPISLASFGVVNIDLFSEKIMCPQEMFNLLEVDQHFTETNKKIPYPKGNKRKQLQLENRKYMQRLK